MVEKLELPETSERSEIYRAILPQIASLIEHESDLIADLANISAVLKESCHFFWVGFYMKNGCDSVLGPFQGTLACTRITVEPTPRGVCGASASQKETIIVPDVEEFPGHIACSSQSRSEIVVPLVVKDETFLVLDVDSNKVNDFSAVDKDYLEKLISLIHSKHF